ncbi:MAG TPA: ethanolamine ammonia-lyase reactivating factor EutA [Gaiellales bacterium]|nr:ethanolamine ammonia-lyase reactivating factor EutA [Gaiellales bacterium]
MAQSFYYAVVVALGIANVLLAAVAYRQRSRQLAGRRLHESQVALAEQRNRMAAERFELLEQQVALLVSIRDAMPIPPPARSTRHASSPVGVIDVGSSTMRLVVVRRDDSGEPRRIADERAFLHLGAELASSGRYGIRTLREVRARAAAFHHHAATLGCDRLTVVVTAPGRCGENADELVDALAGATGRHVSVLSPEEEAALAFRGAARGTATSDRRLAVCDVGGGSTEIAFGTAASGVFSTACFDIGAVTLAEKHFSASKQRTDAEIETARASAREAIQLGDLPATDVLIACGGSARALAKIVGPVADADELNQGLATALDPPKRLTRRLHPKRRWSLPAGILLMEGIQAQLGMPVILSSCGLREGIVETMLNAEPGTEHEALRAS